MFALFLFHIEHKYYFTYIVQSLVREHLTDVHTLACYTNQTGVVCQTQQCTFSNLIFFFSQS